MAYYDIAHKSMLGWYVCLIHDFVTHLPQHTRSSSINQLTKGLQGIQPAYPPCIPTLPKHSSEARACTRAKRDKLYCEFTVAGATDKPGYPCSIEFKPVINTLSLTTGLLNLTRISCMVKAAIVTSHCLDQWWPYTWTMHLVDDIIQCDFRCVKIHYCFIFSQKSATQNVEIVGNDIKVVCKICAIYLKCDTDMILYFSLIFSHAMNNDVFWG